MLFSALKKIFSSKAWISLYLVLVFIGCIVWWFTTDVKITLGNLGSEGKTLYVYFDILLSVGMIFLFPLFITSFLYRWYALGDKTKMKKKTGIGLIGGIIGTILSGCSCCGVTLASYLGLLPLMSLLPYEWLLGIKFIGLLGLLYALYETLIHLESCAIKKKA